MEKLILTDLQTQTRLSEIKKIQSEIRKLSGGRLNPQYKNLWQKLQKLENLTILES